MLKQFLGLICGVLLIIPSYSHTAVANTAQYPAEIINTAKSRLNSVERKSQEATVKVVHEDIAAFGTGTYFTLKEHHIVITAAHVVIDKERLTIQSPTGHQQYGYVVYTDEIADIAVLIVSPIVDRAPIKLNSLKIQTDLLGVPIIYSGFPNDHDLMLIRGTIAGFDAGDQTLLAQSYAWMGASGSGVFDRKTGDFVGVLSAVDVGMAFYPQLVETIVWVSPSWKIDRKSLLKVLDSFKIPKRDKLIKDHEE
jgi:hypothetical protein